MKRILGIIAVLLMLASVSALAGGETGNSEMSYGGTETGNGGG